MSGDDLQFTVLERLLLERSTDLAATRRRLQLVVASGLLLLVALVVASALVRSWELLLLFAVVYVLATTWERVGYARTILVYKGLIQKLAGRLDVLEPADDPPSFS